MDSKKDIHSLIGYVEKFHDSFGIKNNYEPTTQLSQNDIQLRFDLLNEENEEYINAAKNGDMIEVADALGDLMYILFGTIMKHGMQHKIVEVFEEIQRSNMSKLGKDGKPIYREDGKVLKGPNYFKPNIQTILNK